MMMNHSLIVGNEVQIYVYVETFGSNAKKEKKKIDKSGFAKLNVFCFNIKNVK